MITIFYACTDFKICSMIISKERKMRQITISILSVFIALPAFANARLPVVNVASGGVSARAAFGEETQKRAVTPRVVARTQTQKPATEPVVQTRVARSASVISTAPTVSVDAGMPLMASGDVLSPRRPSADLWARNDGMLRMPTADEFSVIRSDVALPEESLDAKPVRVASAAPVVQRVAHVENDVPAPQPLAEIDNQIARLNDLQRRADNSVRNVSNRVIAAPIADIPATPTKIADASSVRGADIPVEKVAVRRMVVPMADEVVTRVVEKNTSPRIAAVRDDMSKMSPSELRQAFRKTFLSENKHFSTYRMDDDFDTVSDMTTSTEGFTARHSLSESSKIRELEIKINFRNNDSALSRENYQLLTQYASFVTNNPTRAVQVAIPQKMTLNKDTRKLAARRLAIIEQALTDNGVSLQRIVPVLSQRNDGGIVLRILSNEQYETLTQQSYNMFGDNTGQKTYKSMTW